MNPPKMPIHIGDYKRDTGHLRAAQHGAYLLLLFHHWSTGSLPDDDEQLASIACMTRAEWKRARPIIERFFKPGWRHGRVEEDLASARAAYEKRAKAGSQGGKAKAESKQSSSNATALPQQPLTLDQIPDKEDPSLRSGARKRATRLTNDWWPTQANVEYAIAKGLTLERTNLEAEKFRNHWTAKAGKDATKLDWDATWQNWILRALETPNGHARPRAETLTERGQRLADQARQLEFAAGVGRADDPFGGH